MKYTIVIVQRKNYSIKSLLLGTSDLSFTIIIEFRLPGFVKVDSDGRFRFYLDSA